MNRSLLHSIVGSALLVLFAPKAGAQGIAVRILDAPPSAYSFEPIWVTFEVRNESEAPVVIPADSQLVAEQGASLEVGLSGEPLMSSIVVYDLVPVKLVWLPPGGRWLFFQRIVLPWAEGAVELEAVLRGPGECAGSPIGPEAHRIKPVRPIVRGSRPYDCWSGEERSQRITVVVETPDTAVDLAALEFMKFDRVKSSRALLSKFSGLREHFPTSHYTYAAYAAIGSVTMLDAVLLQPDNPLNRWAAGAAAEYLARRNRHCGGLEPPIPGAPPDLAVRLARVVAAYPTPAPVKDYLRQLELEYASEECPGRDSMGLER